MNLGATFLRHIELGSIKPNLVVVFSPPGRFFTTPQSNKPNSTPNYDGSASYIFWKHEPDSILDTTEAKFENHLMRRIGQNVPLNCVDSASISGSEIDLKEASTQDDSVDINIVVSDVSDKSFFQSLIARNVELYFGFRDDGYAFEDYERFYVGALRGIVSNSALSLTLKVGNIADYWNKVWRHSQSLRPTTLAYSYPLDEAFQKEGDGNRLGVKPTEMSFKPEWALRQIGKNLKPWGFDYRGFGHLLDNNRYSIVADRFFFSDRAAARRPELLTFPARPEYKLSSRPANVTPFWTAGGAYRDRNAQVYMREYEPFYPTSMFIFNPSGPLSNIEKSAPELVESFDKYPTIDPGFLRSIRSPVTKNRIRFKIGGAVIESQYIDNVAVYPYLAYANTSLEPHRGFVYPEDTSVADIRRLYVKNLVNYVQRTQYGGAPTIAQLDKFYVNYWRTSAYLASFQRINFLPFIRGGVGENGEIIRDVPNPDPYTLDRRTYIDFYGGPIPQFNFATKLKIYKHREFEEVEFGGGKHELPKPPSFSAGDSVQFYDLSTGLGQIGDIIVNNLTRNLYIPLAAIDSESFAEATRNYISGISAPKDSNGQFLNSDYAFSGGEDDFTEHLEKKILKSNNLRIISDGGVLRCIYLGLNNLREKQSGDDPFLLSEDDIIETTVYETRHQDYISGLKLRAGFQDLENEEQYVSFFAQDVRNPGRTSGSIQVFENPPPIDIDVDEIDLYTNFTQSSATVDSLADLEHGMVGPLFSNRRRGTKWRLKPWVERFVRDYFNVNNPFIRLTVVAGARALAVDVGEIIVLRDHKGIELFGSQFCKVMITNKSVNNWGTEAVQVTLDCLFISKSLDFLETGDVDAPTDLRLVSKTRNADEPYNITDAVVTWDEPSDWGQSEDESLYFYEVVEATASGDRVLFKLAADTNSSEDGSYIWTAATRRLRMQLDNPGPYHIYVRADNGVKKSAASNILTIETFASSVKPTPPNMLTGTKDGRTAVLEWRAPDNLGNEASITYNLYVDGRLFLNVGSSLNYRYRVEGTEARSVSFFVTAENSRGESLPSNTVTLDFDAQRPVPTGSIQLSTVENGTNAIRLVITHSLQEADSLEITRDGVSIRTVQVGASPQNFEDLGLQPNTRYCYRVIALNDTGPGVESNMSCATTLEDIQTAVPGPVRSLRSTDVRSDAIDVGWLAPHEEGSSPITHYNVCLSTDNNNFVCQTLTELEHTYSSLAMSTTYYIRVSAVNAVGEGPRELIVVDTLGTGLAPAKPVLSADQTEYDSPFEITLNFDLPNLISDVITSYTIEKSTDNLSWATLTTNTSPAASNTYRDRAGLVDRATYYYRARTANSVGNSAYSDVVSVQVVDCEKREAVISDINVRFKDATPVQKQTGSWILYDRQLNVDGEGTDDPCGGYDFDDPEELSRVRNLTVLFITNTQADIEWDAPRFLGGYPIAFYEVEVVGHAFSQNVTALNTTIMELVAATQYTVRVRPVNTFGSIGPWATITFTTTGVAPPPPMNVPGKPTNLRILTSHSATDKTFFWSVPDELGVPPLHNYVLRLDGSDYNSPDDGTRLRVTNLQYATRYTATVAARNTVGLGEFSEPFSFTTPDGRPAPPRNIRLSVVNETSIKVDWDAPRVTNGQITGYAVYYRELLSGRAWTRVDVGNVLTTTIENFQRGKTYEFDMTASTSAGESVVTGSPVRITVSQYTAPGAPSIDCEEPPRPPE